MVLALMILTLVLLVLALIAQFKGNLGTVADELASNGSSSKVAHPKTSTK